ncbi:MAG: glycosyltransferase family 2 protein [Candidatus Schekmanbacteria bacterium]|nr:glycosyltransferase family 2 protein [Candidatus Schekmanbacteria bacterium]
MSGNRSDVSLTIVNWNSMKYIDQCLSSIERQTHRPLEIIIVDNCSTDGSREHIKKVYPHIRLIENKDNSGFSRAHNQAFRIARGDFIIPLNYDIVLEPTFIEEMVNAANGSDDIGMVSGKLFKKIEEDKTSILDSTGITMNNMFSADRGENENDNGRFNKCEFLFGASGAAPLLKKEMLEDIRIGDEYFDEDMFIYVEDVDLCWRAQLSGWKCIFTPYAVAYHERGATRKDSEKIKREYLTIGYRNRYLAIFKNSFAGTIIRYFPRILFRETYFFTAHLLNGNFFIFNVPFSTLAMIPKMVKKRREIRKKRKVTADYMEKFFFQ